MTAIDIEEYPIHTLTTVLKYFFRELPEPLLTFELYDDFLRTAGTVYSNQMQWIHIGIKWQIGSPANFLNLLFFWQLLPYEIAIKIWQSQIYIVATVNS